MMVPVEKARPGMRLAEDIVLPTGMVLVNGPCTLTEKILDILRRRGIPYIHVVAGEGDAPTSNQIVTSEVPRDDIAELSSALAESEQPLLTARPQIDIFLAQDSMSAKLRILPSGAPNEVLEASDIFDALRSRGIVYGINEAKIGALLEKWGACHRMYEIDGVALGQPPSPGRDGEWDLTIRHLADALRCAEVRKSTYFWQVSGLGADVDPVHPGTVIARRGPGMPPVPGKNILGELILLDSVVRAVTVLDSTVEVSQDGEEAVARESGIAFHADKVIGVLPLSLNGSMELFIDPYRMKADLMVHPAAKGGALPGRREIQELIDRSAIVHGLDDAVLQRICKELEKGFCSEGAVTIAAGTPPRDGQNGKTKFLFPTETSLRPKANPDGSVDFKSVDIVHSVKKGDALASLEPPTKGTSGTDVMGREIPGKDGTPAKLPIGSNTEAHPEQADVLIAATDGLVRYANGVVEISEGFVIRGDVDFSTGNVKYAKSVIVNGDIKSGFSIECGGDLQVAGTVEDCHLLVGGNVLCRQGFVGQGKGVIEAKGDVNIGFVKNQTVRCRGSITIAKEALNVNLFAKKGVVLHGNPLSIAGGTVTARDSITAYSAGSKSNVKTTLEVGIDFDLVDELSKTEARLSEVQESLRKLSETYKRYDQALKSRKHLTPKEEFLFEKLRNSLSKYEMGVKTLLERKETISGKMQIGHSAFIRIERAALSGVIFKCGERFLPVKDEVIGPKTVRLIDHQVRII